MSQSIRWNWTKLYLSLVGRAHCVKRNVLSQVFIYVSMSFFQSIEKMITEFLWEGKTQRIRKDQEQKEGWIYTIVCGITGQQIYKRLSIDFGSQRQKGAGNCTSSIPALITTKLPFSPSTHTSSPVVLLHSTECGPNGVTSLNSAISLCKVPFVIICSLQLS